MTTTHIHIILDRTGSMQSIRDDIIGGFNTFLQAQKDLPGTATLTLVQFDSEDPYEVVHNQRSLAEIAPLTSATYVPRGNTPLYDALGRGLLDLESKLANCAEDQRPQKILFVVVTDGLENASREWTLPRVQTLLAAKEKAGWQFVFLSADLSAMQEASVVGFAHEKSLLFDKSGEGSAHAWNSLSRRTREYREAVESREVKSAFAFSEEDRQPPPSPETPGQTKD